MNDIENLKSELLESAETRVKTSNIDNVEELLSRDSLYLTFKNKTDQAIALAEEKVQLSQRMMRLMDNAIDRLSGKIEKYTEERKVVEAAQADMMKSSELKNSRKKHKEEVAITPETPVTEEPQTYCTCGEVEER
ncbi:hypothetical protein WA538_005658 [Blastocystis sp. DL]